MLLRLAFRMGHPLDNGTQVYLSMSRLDLADYLGMEKETISRTISKLRSSGSLQTNGRNKFIINNVTQFSKLTPLGDMYLEMAHKKKLKSENAVDGWNTNPISQLHLGCPVFDT